MKSLHPVILAHNLWRKVTSQSLMRNAFFLMLSSAIAAGVGFLFWNICSRQYSTEEVGLATTLISATALISALSMWGFNNTLISFLPKSRDFKLVDTAVMIVGVSSLVFGCAFIALATLFDPNLPAIMHRPWEKLIILAYIVALSLNALTDSLFVAKRSAQFILAKNALGSIAKLTLPWALVGLAGFGIFASIAAVTVISLAISTYYLVVRLNYRPRLTFSAKQFSKVRKFTTENYVGNIFGILPTTLIPIAASWILGKEQVAFLFIALTISALLNVIPSATSQSFFAEASHEGADIKQLMIKAFRHIYGLLLPAVIVLILGGSLLLGVFGQAYSASLHVLQLLAIANLFGVINYLGDTYLNVQHRTKAFILMNGVNAVSVVGFAVIGMQHFGLVGAGYGWLAGQIATNCVYVALMSGSKKQALATETVAA